MKFLILAVSLAVNISFAETGAFGIRMGTKESQINSIVKKKINPNYFSLRRAPKPHPSFETYAVVVGKKVGVCRVSGLGKTIENDSYGFNLKSEFEKVTSQLTKIYGEPTSTYDFLNDGSIWNEARDWMMGLHQEERTLANYWTGVEHETIRSISLTAIGASLNTGYIVLRYEFKNYDDCVAEIEAADSEGL